MRELNQPDFNEIRQEEMPLLDRVDTEKTCQ